MADSTDRKKRLLILLILLLVVGFLATSLVSYFVSRSSLRAQIDSTALPLTSDNVYSEIQRDFFRPVSISAFMASDTFLRDWVLAGEEDETEIARYLKEVMARFGTFNSFFVSERTRKYYYPGGVLKRVDPEEERDRWYFRVRQMEADHEINIDPDMANKDAMTIFVNYRVYDYEGDYIGATGVGLTIRSVAALIESYREKYDRDIYFVDRDGRIVLSGESDGGEAVNIRSLEGIGEIADQILTADRKVLEYEREGRSVHLNSRFIPELDWYLLVEQTEETATGPLHGALFVNLVFCLLITGIVILLTALTMNAYQRINERQQAEIASQHRELLGKNAALEEALAEVKQLSGLLPICSACKKIRDDRGYWRQIESYIQSHSEAEFSHSICPECMRRLYPDYYDGEGEEPC